jgi:hypothetical protein
VLHRLLGTTTFTLRLLFPEVRESLRFLLVGEWHRNCSSNLVGVLESTLRFLTVDPWLDRLFCEMRSGVTPMNFFIEVEKVSRIYDLDCKVGVLDRVGLGL